MTTVYPTANYNTDGTTPQKHIMGSGVVATIKGTGTNAVPYYVATDHLTGSNLVTNTSGVQEELMDYYPFGAIRLDEKAGSFGEQRKYAGHEYDVDTQLSYMNARYYDAARGRFTSQDPVFLAIGDNGLIKQLTDQELRQILSDPQNFNSYAYGRNNPLSYNDPTGQWSINVFAVLPNSWQVEIGNAANNAYNNNAVARYALDHPYQAGAAIGVLAGAAVAGGVVAAGGSITCGILCGGSTATIVATGSTAAATHGNKVTNILNSAQSTILNANQRQFISQSIGNQKLANIFNKLYQLRDDLPGGTAGAIRHTAETGKLVEGSNHIQKGYDSLRGLQNVLNTKGISSQDRTITQTLYNQLSQALKSTQK